MLSLKYSKQFKKDLKKYKNDETVLRELGSVLDELISGKKLSAKYSNHQLIGEFKNCYECHVRPDVLLIYKIEENEIVVLLLRIGSHSKLY